MSHWSVYDLIGFKQGRDSNSYNLSGLVF